MPRKSRSAQTDSLYAFDEALRARLGVKVERMASVRAFVGRAWRASGVRYCAPRVVAWGRSHSEAEGRSVMRLARRMRDRVTALHELRHLQGSMSGHGRGFVRGYLILIERHFPIERGELLLLAALYGVL